MEAMEATGPPSLPSANAIVSIDCCLAKGTPTSVPTMLHGCENDDVCNLSDIPPTTSVSLRREITRSEKRQKQLLGLPMSFQDVSEDASIPHQTYRAIPITGDTPGIPISRILNLPQVRPKRQTRLRPVDEFPDIPYGDPIIQKGRKARESSSRMLKALLIQRLVTTMATTWLVCPLIKLIFSALLKLTRAGAIPTYGRIFKIWRANIFDRIEYRLVPPRHQWIDAVNENLSRQEVVLRWPRGAPCPSPLAMLL
jgi:hypothetical protein